MRPLKEIKISNWLINEADQNLWIDLKKVNTLTTMK